MNNKFSNDASNNKIIHTTHKSNVHPNYKYFQKFLFFGLIIFSTYLILNRPAHLPLPQAFLAISIIWCGIIPGFIYLNDVNRPPFPFIPVIGFFYSIWFGLSSFNDEIRILGGQSQLSLKALTLILIGMIIFFISYYLSKISLWKNFTHIKLPTHFPLNNLRILIWFLLLINITALFSSWAHNFSSISNLYQPFGYIAFGLFLILWLRGNLSILETSIIFLIFAPIEMMYLFSTGSLAQIFFFLLFLLFVFWYHFKKVPILMIICIATSIIIINPVKDEYRYLTWNGGIYQNINFVDKTALFFRLITDHYFKKKSMEPLKKATMKNLNRFNHISIFSHVTHLSPDPIPFWQGETYKGIFIKFIPRTFWPDKPSLPTGNIFGKRYGFISPSDRSTSVNLQWTVEMYVNFGNLGVIIGMGLVGILLSLVEKKLNHPDMSYVEFIVGLAILLPISHPESGLINSLGPLIFLPIVLYFIFQFALRLKTR